MQKLWSDSSSGFKKMNKKGNVMFDLFLIIGFILMFSMIVIIGFKISSEWRYGIEDKDMSEYSITAANENRSALLKMDYAVLTIIIGLAIATIISGFFIRSYPAFFITSLILLILVVLISAIVSNVFTSFSQSPGVSNETSQFTVIPAVMDNLPLYAVIIGVLMIIVLYGKSRMAGDYAT